MRLDTNCWRGWLHTQLFSTQEAEVTILTLFQVKAENFDGKDVWKLCSCNLFQNLKRCSSVLGYEIYTVHIEFWGHGRPADMRAFIFPSVFQHLLSALQEAVFQFSTHGDSLRLKRRNFPNTNSHSVLSEPVSAPRNEIISLKWNWTRFLSCTDCVCPQMLPEMERQPHSAGQVDQVQTHQEICCICFTAAALANNYLFLVVVKLRLLVHVCVPQQSKSLPL